MVPLFLLWGREMGFRTGKVDLKQVKIKARELGKGGIEILFCAGHAQGTKPSLPLNQ